MIRSARSERVYLKKLETQDGPAAVGGQLETHLVITSKKGGSGEKASGDLGNLSGAGRSSIFIFPREAR